MDPDPNTQVPQVPEVAPDPGAIPQVPQQQPPLQVLSNDPPEELTFEEQFARFQQETRQKFDEQDKQHKQELHQRDLEIARMQGRLEAGGGQQGRPSLPFNTPEQWNTVAGVVRTAAQLAQHGQFDEQGEMLRQQIGQQAQLMNNEYNLWASQHQQEQQQRQLRQFQIENYINQSGLDTNSTEAEVLRKSVQGEPTSPDFIQKILDERRRALAAAGGHAAQQATSAQLGAQTSIESPLSRPMPQQAQGRRPTDEQIRAQLDASTANSLLKIVPSEQRMSDPDFDKNLFGTA